MPPMEFEYFITINGEKILSSPDVKEPREFYYLLCKGRTDNVKQIQLVCRCTFRGGYSKGVGSTEILEESNYE